MTITMDAARLTLWRDHDDEVLQIPALHAGTRPALGPDDPSTFAADLFHSGVRRVALDQPVDLSGATGPRPLISTMLLLGELTSWGIRIDWDVQLGPDPEIWRSLSHLHPPRRVLDTEQGDAIRQDWRRTFYLCKCVYRRGPGFVQVRDRRGDGALSRFTVYDPAYLDAVRRLAAGCPADDVPAGILDELVTESLAGRAGSMAWWLPYRVRRWPWPSFAV